MTSPPHARIRAHKGQETLDWAHSVQDLLTLAGQDHSAQARRWMAEKLQWPGDVPDDPTVMSAEMNAWLCTRLLTPGVREGASQRRAPAKLPTRPMRPSVVKEIG